MRGIKIYLIVVTVLLIIALCFGVYVWYVLQTFKSGQASQTETADTPVGEEQAKTKAAPSVAATTTPEPIVIQKSDLPSVQQSALDAVGVTGDTITITPAMISCAENVLGKERVDEIIAGAVPGPLETFRLAPCIKK